MHILHQAATFATLCGLAAAQSFVVSPDAAYNLSEGGEPATTFGGFAAARYQILDGNLRGNAMTIKAVGMRHDHLSYDVSNGMGRRWQNVTVLAAEGDLAAFGATFGTNTTTTPTKVFDAPMSWPVQLGAPQEVPSAWSLQIPFSASFGYSGNADLVLDFTFAGGALDNRAAWSGAQPVPYALDSFSVGQFIDAAAVTMGNVNGGCTDSGSSSLVGASVLMQTSTYGPNFPNASLRNRILVTATGKDFGAQAATVLVLAFGAETNGFLFPGVNCNRVHLTQTKLWFFHPVITDILGNVAPYRFGFPSGATYSPLYHGIDVVTQGVWQDTGNGALKFSSLSRNSLVTVPFDTAADVKMKAAFNPDPTATTASVTSTGANANIPLLRYER